MLEKGEKNLKSELKNRIRIGRIVNTHGLRGEVKVYPLTDQAERFEELDYLFIGEGEEKKKLLSVKHHKNMVLLRIEGIDSIEKAEALREKYLFIDRENLRELEEDEHLIADLIGLSVIDVSGNPVGVLKDVLSYAANDVYLIESPEGREYLIPGLKRFVPEIDMEKGQILIDPIEGMIEE